MTAAVMTRWLQQVFIPNCGTKRPIVLLLRASAGHLGVEFMDLARENQITLIGLPYTPAASSCCQPLSAHLFEPLQQRLGEVVEEEGEDLLFWDLPQSLQYAMDEVLTVKVIADSFRQCGLVPCDRSAVAV